MHGVITYAASEAEKINDIACASETFTARCQSDEVIVILEANYGRMGINRLFLQDSPMVAQTKLFGVWKQ